MKRYDMRNDMILEDDDGPFVRFDDHDAEIARLRAKLDAAKKTLARNHRDCEEAAKSYPGIHGESFSVVEALAWYESQLDAAIDALETLCDLQNGPPLPKYETAWTEAMGKARSIIKKQRSPTMGTKIPNPAHTMSPDALALAAEWWRVEDMGVDFFRLTFAAVEAGCYWRAEWTFGRGVSGVSSGPTPAAAIIAAHEAWKKEQGK